MKKRITVFYLGVFFISISIYFVGCIKVASEPTPKPTYISNLISDPLDLSIDKSGNIYITNGNYYNVLKVSTGGTITSIAGTGTNQGCMGDGGLATLAKLRNPWGICLDSVGNIYFADAGCNLVHTINISTGVMTAIAGDGNNGYGGDGGLATAAKLNTAIGVTLGNAGEIYIADEGNNRIRKLNNKTGIITTIAGNGLPGKTGDGGPATSCELYKPYDVALDDSGNIFISDGGNYIIRKISAITGIITTIAGNGQSSFNGDSIPATSAAINAAFIVLDSARNIYLTDFNNNRVRKVNTKTGLVTTIAGTGINGFSGEGIIGTSAEISQPEGLIIDNLGNLYFCDSGNNRIRKITISTGIITTVAHN